MGKTPAVLGVIGAAIALPVGCGVYSVWTSVATAPARVINRTLETSNILTNYELFHDESEQFRARTAQIREHSSMLAEEHDPAEHTRLRMEMAAQQQSCRELAADYNANSQKLNRELFKDRGLPAILDTSACEQENAK